MPEYDNEAHLEYIKKRGYKLHKCGGRVKYKTAEQARGSDRFSFKCDKCGAWHHQKLAASLQKRFDRSCHQKRRWETEEEATQKGMQHYECEFCKGWHRANKPGVKAVSMTKMMTTYEPEATTTTKRDRKYGS